MCIPKKWLLACLCLSLCLSACVSSTATRRTSVKLGIGGGGFYENVSGENIDLVNTGQKRRNCT